MRAASDRKCLDAEMVRPGGESRSHTFVAPRTLFHEAAAVLSKELPQDFVAVARIASALPEV